MTTCMMTRSRLLSTLIVLSVFVTANGFSEETVQSGYPVCRYGTIALVMIPINTSLRPVWAMPFSVKTHSIKDSRCSPQKIYNGR